MTETCQDAAVQTPIPGRVLVTGAGGFLGGFVVERLLQAGAQVRCLVRPGGRFGRLQELSGRTRDRVEVVTDGLITVAAARQTLAEQSLVIHLAGRMSGTDGELRRDIVETSRPLLEAIAGLSAPPTVILVSSFGVYGFAALRSGAVVDESTPLEANPDRRDPYSRAKLEQELLFRAFQERTGFPLVVVRPGTVHGAGGIALPSRVGVWHGNRFLLLGHRNILPLTYVENCADAILTVARDPRSLGSTFNVVDDDLPTCADFLDRYRRSVRPLRYVPVPYPALLAWAKVRTLHRRADAIDHSPFTPYRVRTTWRGYRYTNARLKSAGWRPAIDMDEALRRTFASLRESSGRR